MRATSILKLASAVAVLACVTIFILQNREQLELRFFVWSFETRRAFMLLAVFGSGLATGWIIATISQLGFRSHDEMEANRRSR